MPFDKFKSPEQLWEERRKGVAQSVRTITVEELKQIVRQHEDEFINDPWRDEFLRLLEERPQPTFYTAVPQADAVVYYCRDKDFGVWVLRGSGMGPLDSTGKRVMKEVIEGSLSGHKFGGKS